MLFVFALITGPLVSLILMATYFQEYVFLFVITLLVFNAAIMMFIFCRQERGILGVPILYGHNDEKEKQKSIFIFFVSIFTSWVSPCTVSYNEGKHSKTYFLLFSSCITLAIHLLGICFLFGFINIHGIVEASFPPIFHCFVNESINDTLYQLMAASDNLIQICSDCLPSRHLCNDNQDPNDLFNNLIGPVAVFFIILSFASAIALQFLGNYKILYKLSNILCCNNPISWDREGNLYEYAHRQFERFKNILNPVWREQPIFKHIKEKKLGAVCRLHFFGANCEIFDKSINSALDILSKAIDENKINFDHFSAFVKWYCIKLLGLYQNAVCHKYFNCAKILLNNGADVNCVVDKDGNTFLYFAAEEDCLQVVKFLLDAKANVNFKNINFETPLHCAVSNGHFEIVQVLIEKGADIHDREKDGRTPLHFAADNRVFEIVQVLIGKGANIHDRDENGWTPLHYAAQNGYCETVQLLIEIGANINEQSNYGMIPLHLAAENGHFEATKLLIENGAIITNKDRSGKTPLHLAAEEGHIEIVQLMIEKEANINDRDKYGGTPLHLAAEKGHIGIVQLMIEKEANINDRDKYGRTPLHSAALSNEYKTVQLLINNGASIDAKKEDGKTPLHLAAEWCKFETVQLLVEKGANLTEKTNKGLTALGLLEKSNYNYYRHEQREKCREILLSAGLRK